MTCGSHYRTIIPHVKIIMREMVNVQRVLRLRPHHFDTSFRTLSASLTLSLILALSQVPCGDASQGEGILSFPKFFLLRASPSTLPAKTRRLPSHARVLQIVVGSGRCNTSSIDVWCPTVQGNTPGRNPQ